jgi:hypothetical protein
VIRPEPLLFPERLDAKVVERLRSFADLKLGWCGGDGCPTYGEPTCKKAIDWALLVCSQIVGVVEMPATFPTPGGGVELEWRLEASPEQWMIGLAVFSDGGVWNVRGDSSTAAWGWCREFEGPAADVLGCVRWLLSHWLVEPWGEKSERQYQAVLAKARASGQSAGVE